jgi:hypothetical protein
LLPINVIIAARLGPAGLSTSLTRRHAAIDKIRRRKSKLPPLARLRLQRIDNRLTIGDEITKVIIKVEDPIERLLGRRDIVARTRG